MMSQLQVGMQWCVRGGLSSTRAARVDLSRKLSSKVSAAPFAVQSSSTPLLMHPPGLVGDSDQEHYHLFSVATKKVIKIKKYFEIPWRKQHFIPQEDIVCIGSSRYGWQVLANKRTCDFFLFNPLGNPLNLSHTFIPLPRVESLRNFISGFHRHKTIATTATTKVFDLESEYTVFGEESALSSESVGPYVFDKLVLSSPPLTGDHQDGYNEDCFLLARDEGGIGRDGSSFVWCRPGDTAWTSLYNPGHSYSQGDFTYFSPHQLFYFVNEYGYVESLDFRSRNSKNAWSSVCNSLFPKLQPTMNEHQIKLRSHHAHYYLVDSCSELLAVVRYKRRLDVVDCDGKKTKKKSTVAFDVYKFDFYKKKWVYVPHLGNDRVLFLDQLNGFSVSLSDDPAGLISGNSIYFSFGVGEEDDHDSGVCNLEDGSITTFLPQCSNSSPSKKMNQFSSSSPPMWIYPRLSSLALS